MPTKQMSAAPSARLTESLDSLNAVAADRYKKRLADVIDLELKTIAELDQAQARLANTEHSLALRRVAELRAKQLELSLSARPAAEKRLLKANKSAMSSAFVAKLESLIRDVQGRISRVCNLADVVVGYHGNNEERKQEDAARVAAEWAQRTARIAGLREQLMRSLRIRDGRVQDFENCYGEIVQAVALCDVHDFGGEE